MLAGDHDLIRDEHTLEIFHHIPNSQLCIFPDATHMVPYDDPALFNATVERFFRDAVREEGPDQGLPCVLRIDDGVAAGEVGGGAA